MLYRLKTTFKNTVKGTNSRARHVSYKTCSRIQLSDNLRGGQGCGAGKSDKNVRYEHGEGLDLESCQDAICGVGPYKKAHLRSAFGGRLEYYWRGQT